MSLHDVNSLIIETETATESLPDPATVISRTHWLTNTGYPAAAVWSSVGATPFLIAGVPTATLTVPPGERREVYSNGVNWVVLPSVGGALLAPAPTAPARALNAAFTPHATRPVLATYSVEIGGTTTLLSGDDGRIELRSDPGAPATVRSQHRGRVFQGLGVTVGTNVIIGGEVSFLVPAGWQVILATVVTVAAPTFTLTRVSEIVL